MFSKQRKITISHNAVAIYVAASTKLLNNTLSLLVRRYVSRGPKAKYSLTKAVGVSTHRPNSRTIALEDTELHLFDKLNKSYKN